MKPEDNWPLAMLLLQIREEWGNILLGNWIRSYIYHFSLFQAFFRDHRSIDYTDSQRELRVQQDLKWSSDPPILLSPLKSDGDEMNPILRSPSLQISQNNRKWNKAHFQLKGDPHLGPVLMYAPRVQQQFVAFTTATNSASSKVRHPFKWKIHIFRKFPFCTK